MKKKLKSIRDFYFNLHLQAKFTITYFVIILVPMILICLMFSPKLYSMVVADTLQSQQDASEKTGPKINSIVEKIVKSCNAIEDYIVYKKLIYMDSDKSISQFLDRKEGQNFLNNIQLAKQKSSISSIKIYVDIPDTHPLFQSSKSKSYFEPISSAKGSYWYGIFQGTHCLSLHCPAFYLTATEIREYGNMAYITKTSIPYDGKSIPIYTAVYYSNDIFLSDLQKNISSQNSVAYIIDSRDSKINSTDAGLASTYYFSYDTVEQSLLSSNNFIQKNVLGENVYAGFYRIEIPNWLLIVAFPSKPLIHKSNLMMAKIALLYLAVILFATVIAVNMSRSITKRISSVIAKMRTARLGVPHPMEPSQYHDEVGDLIDTYNYMTTQLEQLLKKQAESAEALRIAEFDALQSQINPHFLYNTMDMINWLAQQGKSSEVTKAIQNLSRYYKLTLGHKKSFGTVEEEIEHVSIYVHLQNMRFHDRINFVMDVPDELSEYQIPKLTLQPVVENAILHGIMETESKCGTIVITGWLEGEDFVLLVSDDGIGMSEEILQRILTKKGVNSKKGTNIAIYNTHQRIMLLYGEGYGLSYSSVVGRGTEVQIRLPVGG